MARLELELYHLELTESGTRSSFVETIPVEVKTNSLGSQVFNPTIKYQPFGVVVAWRGDKESVFPWHTVRAAVFFKEEA